MQEQKLANNGKEWVQPELKKLEAGAAETGSNVNEDGNSSALNARS